MTLSKTIAVFGGNGFLGRKICETGVQLGYNVISFSRSGEPPKEVISKPWLKNVQWEKANLMDPTSYKSKLKSVDTVVHSVGMLFENQSYKKSLNSNFSSLTDFTNFLKGSNPMKKDEGSSIEAIQRDSAVLLGDAFLEAQEKEVMKKTKKPKVKKTSETPETTEKPSETGKLPNFVYISADNKPPIVPDAYLTSKREAEFELSCKKGLRTIFMRPGFMYEVDHEGRTNARDVLANFLKMGYFVKEGVVGDNIEFVNKIVRPAVSTDKVAFKLFEKLEEDAFEGVVELEDIVRY